VDSAGETGADGIAFLVQSTEIIGASGGGIGYAGLLNSVAVEIDTFKNSNDLDSNHIGINVNGDTESNEANSVFVNDQFDNEQLWTVWIDYADNRLEVRASMSNSKPDLPLLSENVSISDVLNNGSGFIGFTSATGSAHSNHDIVSWELSTPE